MLRPLLGEIVLLPGEQPGGGIELAVCRQILQVIALIEERRAEILGNAGRLTRLDDRTAAPVGLARRQPDGRNQDCGDRKSAEHTSHG